MIFFSHSIAQIILKLQKPNMNICQPHYILSIAMIIEQKHLGFHSKYLTMLT